MVSRRKRPDKETRVEFAAPPWDQYHPDWIRLDEQLPVDHPAPSMVNEEQVQKRLQQLKQACECDERGEVPDLVPAWIAKHPGTRNEQQQRYRCSPEHCRICPLRHPCTTNPDRGRSIRRSEHEELIEAHHARMATDAAKQLYKLRRQTVELGFADMKEHCHLRRFNGRGLNRARAQTGLTVLAHNLLHVIRAPSPTKNHSDAALTPEKTTA